MKRTIVSAFALALLLGLGAGVALPTKVAAAHKAQGQHQMMGQGQMPMKGQGQMPMKGHGKMRQGTGPMMGPGMGPRVVPIKHLSLDDVRHFLEHRLDGQGYKRLKVGTVEEKDKATIVAEVVTAEGSLVQRFEVDRHSGHIKQVD